jgi:photosystem II stability/assembly factor-like uncharacterized protein
MIWSIYLMEVTSMKSLRIIWYGTILFSFSLLAQNTVDAMRLGDATSSSYPSLYYYRMGGRFFYQQPAVSLQFPASRSSRNQGGVWEKLDVYGGDVNDLVVHPNGDLFVATFSGVYRSTDNGEIWEETNTQLPTSTAISLAVNSSGTVFLGKIDGLYKSNDIGNSWVQVSPNVSSSIEALMVADGDVLFAGSGSSQGNLFRSTDEGSSWTNVSVPVQNLVWELFNPAPGVILAGTAFSGIYLSTDNGDHWNSTTLTTGIMGQFVTNSSGELFVGTYGFPGEHVTGIYHSTDGGAAWVKLQNEIAELRIPALAINSNDVLFAADLDEGDVYRSTDNGASWQVTNSGLDTDFGIRCLRVNSNDEIFTGCVGNGVYRSVDGGDSWSAVKEGLTGFRIDGIAVSQTGNIFVTAFPGGIFRSTNHGSTWEKINSGMPDPACSCVAVNSIGELFAGTLTGMYRSFDNGNTWTEINEGLPIGSFVNAIDLFSDNKSVYIGTSNSGVYYSGDNGDDWIAFNSGLSDLFVPSLTSNANGDLFAGTQVRGAFRRAPQDTSWTQINNGLPMPVPPPIQSMVIHPQSQQIFAAVLGFGVYRSQDNGDNWTITTLAEPWITSLAIDGQGSLFAGNAFFGSSFSNDVYRSTDGGGKLDFDQSRYSDQQSDHFAGGGHP